jgi:hypothetical protein
VITIPAHADRLWLRHGECFRLAQLFEKHPAPSRGIESPRLRPASGFSATGRAEFPSEGRLFGVGLIGMCADRLSSHEYSLNVARLAVTATQ